uniref:Uncharacterized protein n=1 Tax=Ditylenchus dipsaci TaxID=166011 RepID=A0A915DU03_9BILA
MALNHPQWFWTDHSGDFSKIEISVRVDRAASAAPLYQAQPLPKYFSRARTAAVAAGGGYGSSIGAARYYASGAPSKQSQQLHSFQMSSPSKTGSSMAGDSYGSGYWSGTNYNGVWKCLRCSGTWEARGLRFAVAASGTAGG